MATVADRLNSPEPTLGPLIDRAPAAVLQEDCKAQSPLKAAKYR